MPFIPYAQNSKNAIPSKWRKTVKHAALLRALHKQFQADEGAAFKAYYRYRVKVENLFSAIKEKYGGSVRSTEGAGAENEILLKLLCQNVHQLLLAVECYGLDISAISNAGRAA